MFVQLLDFIDSPVLLLSERTSLPDDQIKLLLVLLLCIPLGLCHKLVKTPHFRNIYSFLPGIAFQIWLFREGALYPFINSVVLYGVMLVSPRKRCGIIIFVLSLFSLSVVHIKRMIVFIYIY